MQNFLEFNKHNINFININFINININLYYYKEDYLVQHMRGGRPCGFDAKGTSALK